MFITKFLILSKITELLLCEIVLSSESLIIKDIPYFSLDYERYKLIVKELCKYISDDTQYVSDYINELRFLVYNRIDSTIISNKEFLLFRENSLRLIIGPLYTRLLFGGFCEYDSEFPVDDGIVIDLLNKKED